MKRNRSDNFNEEDTKLLIKLILQYFDEINDTKFSIKKEVNSDEGTLELHNKNFLNFRLGKQLNLNLIISRVEDNDQY